MIEDLPVLRPDAARSTSTVARCHKRLAVQRRKIEARSRARTSRAAGAERLVIAGLCVTYLIAMASDLLAIIAPR